MNKEQRADARSSRCPLVGAGIAGVRGRHLVAMRTNALRSLEHKMNHFPEEVKARKSEAEASLVMFKPSEMPCSARYGSLLALSIFRVFCWAGLDKRARFRQDTAAFRSKSVHAVGLNSL